MSFTSMSRTLILATTTMAGGPYLMAADLGVNGSLFVNGNVTAGGNIAVGNDRGIIASGRLNMSGAEYLVVHNKNGVYVAKSGSGNGNLVTEGGVHAATGISTSGNFTLGVNSQVYSPGQMYINGEGFLYLLNKQGTVISRAWGGNGNFVVEGSARVAGELITSGNVHLAAGNHLYAPGRMHISGGEHLFVLNQAGAVISRAGGGSGNLVAEGVVHAAGDIASNGHMHTGNLNMRAGSQVYSPGLMHINGEDRLWVMNKQGVAISRNWGGNGNLHVEGTIRTSRLEVRANVWADDVFADTYRLTPLSEVAQFVEEHRHLPGIPAQAELEKSGIEVNDMLSRHMRKIEELTLHAINQEKTISRQERIIDAMCKRLGLESELSTTQKPVISAEAP